MTAVCRWSARTGRPRRYPRRSKLVGLERIFQRNEDLDEDTQEDMEGSGTGSRLQQEPSGVRLLDLLLFCSWCELDPTSRNY